MWPLLWIAPPCPTRTAPLSPSPGELVYNFGLLHGFDAVVWCIVVLNGLGGLLVAATMKYADNIVKVAAHTPTTLHRTTPTRAHRITSHDCTARHAPPHARWYTPPLPRPRASLRVLGSASLRRSPSSRARCSRCPSSASRSRPSSSSASAAPSPRPCCTRGRPSGRPCVAEPLRASSDASCCRARRRRKTGRAETPADWSSSTPHQPISTSPREKQRYCCQMLPK
jgi:hypothetical protein